MLGAWSGGSVARDDGPFVRYTDGDGQQHELVLSGDASRVTVGRSEQADLALSWDQEVSRLHAALERIGGAWTIVDDGLSRNGTFVNGERLAGRRRLHAGDSIRIGASLLTFRDFQPLRGEATRLAAEMPTRGSLTESQRAVLVALCRPYKHHASYATPATNQQIASELYLSVDAVKTHLRALFAKFGIEDLPQNQKRVRLVERAMHSGIITEHDL